VDSPDRVPSTAPVHSQRLSTGFEQAVNSLCAGCRQPFQQIVTVVILPVMIGQGRFGKTGISCAFIPICWDKVDHLGNLTAFRGYIVCENQQVGKYQGYIWEIKQASDDP
jgi:hypothetical protein